MAATAQDPSAPLRAEKKDEDRDEDSAHPDRGLAQLHPRPDNIMPSCEGCCGVCGASKLCIGKALQHCIANVLCGMALQWSTRHSMGSRRALCCKRHESSTTRTLIRGAASRFALGACHAVAAVALLRYTSHWMILTCCHRTCAGYHKVALPAVPGRDLHKGGLCCSRGAAPLVALSSCGWPE